MKAMNNIKYFVLVVLLLSSVQLAFVSCDDDPGADNYYTFTGEMASDYLHNREDQFSEFLGILGRSETKVLDLLATYGTYTVFAPTNDAVDAFLAGRGLKSIDELSQKDCDTIAYTHIVRQAFYTTDLSDGTLPTSNMLDRYLTISVDTPDVSKGEEGTVIYYVNKSSRMIVRDDSVENGVVHTINSVINSANDMLPDLLEKDSTISLFVEAMLLTHMHDSLQRHVDETYSCSVDSVEEGVRYHTAVEYEWGYWLKTRFFKYTAFVEKDDVYNAHDIYTIDDLIAYAKTVYDEAYPEDAGLYDDDFTDRRNPLNRFVSYHFMPILGNYNELTPNDLLLTCNFNRRIWDVADWYETLLPYSVIKCSYPNGSQAGRYLNRRGVQSHADSRGVFVRGCKIFSPSESGTADMSAINGVYHYIDDILVYSKDVQDVVFNERMRFDATVLSPDFMSAGTSEGHNARGRYALNEAGPNGGEYSNAGSDGANTRCTVFKPGFVRNWQFTDATFVSVRNRHLHYWSYEGDEIILLGRYNFTIRLPHVPAGTYELRLQTCLGFASRGIIQVYLDDHPCGIPIDMRNGGSHASIGWQSDSSLGDEEAINAFDKAFHNNGWMKGPLSYGSTDANGSGSGFSVMRNGDTELRRVYTTFYTDGQSDHYMHIKQVMDSETAEFAFDYIELVPRSVYDNEYYLEDKN